MKFTWGTGILIFLIIFVLFIGTFVVFAFQQDVNLVHKEYYQKGVDFDQERDRKNRGASQTHQVQVEQTDSKVKIQFNKQYFSQLKDVKIYFYRASDRHEDKRFELKQAELVLDKSDLIKGKYTLNISWIQDDEEYLLEKYFYLK